ncbi:MAG: hypothetical protein GY811_20660 [Myxococcales bacterium]|nr:hypothetical protein [Myxococcales bacterium]
MLRMPGDEWQKFANLRLLFGTMFGTPGKNMLFMGTRPGYRLGVPEKGRYRRLLDSDDVSFGGSGYSEQGDVSSEPVACHGKGESIAMDLGPLSISFWLCESA